MANKEVVSTPEDSETKKAQRKSFWLGFAICFVIAAGLAVGSFFLIRSNMGFKEGEATWRLLTDAFTMPGVIFVLFYALLKVTDMGAFDAIAYGVQVAFLNIFYKDLRKTKLPATYRDYRELKRAKPRVNVSYFLFVGLFYLLLMLIFLIIYYVNR